MSVPNCRNVSALIGDEYQRAATNEELAELLTRDGRDSDARRREVCELECPSMQNLLPIAGIVLGLAVSAAWAGFLGFQLFQVIGLMF